MRHALPLALAALAWASAPALSTPAPEPPPEAVVVTLPFVGDEPNRVYVDLALDGGERFVMLLDTGASASVITPLMARKLGVAVRRNKESAYRRSTRIGRDIQFWVDTQSSDTGSKTGWEYGLLGGEFLDDYVVEIDFAARKVRFLDPKKYEVPKQVEAAGERVVPFKLLGTRISVPVEVNGKQLDVMLDTGSPSTGILSGKAARTAGIDAESLPGFGETGTVLGPMKVNLLETDRFRFAGVDLGSVPLLVAPRGWYNQAGPNDSVIGYDVLQQFALRIDYPRKRLWLKRLPNPRVTFYGADYAAAKRVGAFLTAQGDALHVWGIVSGGAAESYGLREGDAIVPAAGDKRMALEEVLGRIEARGELTVARREGEAWVDHVLPEESDPIGKPAADEAQD